MRFIQFLFVKHRWKSLAIIAICIVAYVFCLPKDLFNNPCSVVLLDRNGELLGAKIAPDGQWRFPTGDSIPYRFERCLLEYEDRRFYQHWGVDFWGIGRALIDNWNYGAVKSGGSTISMQVIRLSNQRTGRAFFAKLFETIIATRLEWSYSKKEILAIYCANAPFGGNVVGLEAASWRYYGKPPSLLSWGEAAALAVLPNSPALVHPGRNRAELLLKRNRLLDKLYQRKILDSLSSSLAKEEPLPEAPLPLPNWASHLLEKHHSTLKGLKNNAQSKLALCRSSVDINYQQRAKNIVQNYYRHYSQQGIHNLAAIIADVETGEILAYIGNVEDEDLSDNHGDKVDIIQAARSTGSILKPFLYAFMLQHGNLLPESLIPDIPTNIQSYRPQNFNNSYEGLVPAEQSIRRSLNVPLVRMLQQYGVDPFLIELKKIGLGTLNKSAQHYGLSLILGGAEASLFDLSSAYASMARTLLHYQKNKDCPYHYQNIRPLSYQLSDVKELAKDKCTPHPPLLDAASIYNCVEALRNLQRPPTEASWEYFESARKVAWKTGTSFGFRDAWAIGFSNRYVIGVWVGNADGEGRPELIGVKTAAPVLFSLFDLMPLEKEQWFEKPVEDFISLDICALSGYKASDACGEHKRSQLCPINSNTMLKLCPYHKTIHLDPTEQYQVHGNCQSPSQMQHKSWFVLPPIEEVYYRAKNPTHLPVPPFRADCLATSEAEALMQFIYPKNFTRIYLPIDYDGKRSSTVFKVVHKTKGQTLYWHLDQEYIGSTKEIHQMELMPKAGKHKVWIVDELGNRISQEFEILNQNK